MRNLILIAIACFCVYAAESRITPMDVINKVIAAAASLVRVG